MTKMTRPDEFVSDKKVAKSRLRAGNTIEITSPDHVPFTFTIEEDIAGSDAVRAIVAKLNGVIPVNVHRYTLSPTPDGYVKVTPGWQY